MEFALPIWIKLAVARSGQADVTQACEHHNDVVVEPTALLIGLRRSPCVTGLANAPNFGT